MRSAGKSNDFVILDLLDAWRLCIVAEVTDLPIDL